MSAPMLGTVNGYISSSAWLNGRRFHFDGTTLGLTVAAVQAGARVGDTVRACFGGHLQHDTRPYVLGATGGGDRTPAGVWADRVWSA